MFSAFFPLIVQSGYLFIQPLFCLLSPTSLFCFGTRLFPAGFSEPLQRYPSVFLHLPSALYLPLFISRLREGLQSIMLLQVWPGWSLQPPSFCMRFTADEMCASWIRVHGCWLVVVCFLSWPQNSLSLAASFFNVSPM